MHRFPDWSRRTAILLFWLFLWHLASLAVQNQILLVGPLDALKALLYSLPPQPPGEPSGFPSAASAWDFLWPSWRVS